MSLLLAPQLQSSRKRTTSFSTPSPRPRKAPRMTQALRRTASYITLPGLDPPATEEDLEETKSSDDLVPYHRTLRYYKEQRERRKAMLHRRSQAAASAHNEQITIHVPKKTSSTPAFDISTALSAGIRPRASSPLAPKRTILPPRASFPRSRPEPDLYKMAITTRMQHSPTGQKILTMGPRLALSIMTATKELERIVAQQQQTDVVMADGTAMSSSWVVVPGEDWEMIDCGA